MQKFSKAKLFHLGVVIWPEHIVHVNIMFSNKICLINDIFCKNVVKRMCNLIKYIWIFMKKNTFKLIIINLSKRVTKKSLFYTTLCCYYIFSCTENEVIINAREETITYDDLIIILQNFELNGSVYKYCNSDR